MPAEPTGLLPLRKPAGPSSAAVVERVRRLTRVRRVGHAGTLDPAADGVLLLAFNRATGCFPYLPTEKSYRAVIRLGIATDTQDGQGVVLSQRPVPSLTEAELQDGLAAFQGRIQQRPPLVSALHHQGRRLYELARAGQTVEIPLRTVEIRRAALLAWSSPDLTLEIDCSRGTYIRSLASDLGERLGCGAHLAALTRTRCSGFALAQTVSLEGLEAAVAGNEWTRLLVDMNVGLMHLPEIRVDGRGRSMVLNGRRLPGRQLPEGTLARITDEAGRLLAVAQIAAQEAVMRRVFGAAGEGGEAG